MNYQLLLWDSIIDDFQYRVWQVLNRKCVVKKASYQMSGMIADHRRNLEGVGKIETLPIFPNCLLPSQMIGMSMILSFH